MRILSLGVPLPGPKIDNHTFANAPSFFDYDAIIVEPRALSRLIEDLADLNDVYGTHFDEPVRNDEGSPTSVAFADLLRRRQAETERLLSRGGLVVCFAQPNVVHTRIEGYSPYERYSWLPAPLEIAYREPYLVAGEGTEIECVDPQHDFASYCQAYRGRLGYRAYFTRLAEGLGRVFARSAGGAAVGIEFSVLNGQAIFLPPPRGLATTEERTKLSSTLQHCIRRALGRAADEPAPWWAANWSLPGLAGLEQASDEARDRVKEAQAALESAETTLAGLEKYRRILWQEGKLGFEAHVREALALLGCSVTEDLDDPAEIWLEGRTALVEIEASTAAVGVEPYRRLRERVDQLIERTGSPQRGLLIVNGDRLQPPAERQQQFDDALRVAAEQASYRIVTAAQLFEAVREHMEGNETQVAAFREKLLSGEGPLEDDWKSIASPPKRRRRSRRRQEGEEPVEGDRESDMGGPATPEGSPPPGRSGFSLTGEGDTGGQASPEPEGHTSEEDGPQDDRKGEET